MVSPSHEPYPRRLGTCAVRPSSAMILRSAFSETRVRSTTLTLRYPYLPLEEANVSATSRINAFPSSGSSTLRRGASASPASRSRRIAGLSAWPAFLFSGRNAAMPPSRYALTRLRTAPRPAPSSSAARFCRMPPGTGSIVLVLVSSGMMGLSIWPATGNPLPASVPGTAWSGGPGARPPGPWSSAWRSTGPPRAVVPRYRTYDNPFVQPPRKRPHPAIHTEPLFTENL